jgi:hypothetical protein
VTGEGAYNREMRRALWFAMLAACGDDGSMDVPIDAAPDAYVIPWWTPEPGETSSWDIQLAAPYDTSAPHGMYILDLFAVSPGGTFMYGDGSTVTVPAGPLAGTIEALHARAPRPVVICRVDTGTINLTDPDASKFPGYAASGYQAATPPAAGSVIGWSFYLQPMRRFLDSRPVARTQWFPLILARYDHAKAIGCDGIMPDGNDTVREDTGFELVLEDQQAMYEESAAAVHARALSAGQRGNYLLGGQPDALADVFDWILPDRCSEFLSCDFIRPYTNAGKAVFAIDHPRDEATMEGVSLSTMCNDYDRYAIQDGLHKDVALSSAYRMECP